MNERRVVVTGLGMATALGLSVEENWQKALAGTSGIKKLDYPGAEHSPVQAVGQVSEEDWERIQRAFPDEASREGERRTLFALWSARQTLMDAGLIKDPLHCAQPPAPSEKAPGREEGLSGRNPLNTRMGAILAAGLGIDRLEDIQRCLDRKGVFDPGKFLTGYRDAHRESIVKNNSHRPSALIADLYWLHGYNATITTACASATQAIGTAFRAIRRGDADVIIAGGSDSMINPVGLVFFVLLGAAAQSSERPEDLCRPFDRKRSGLVMGEGAGLAVLEEETHALARGARIYAEVAGYGTTIDAYQVTAPHPKGEGAEQAMRAALLDAVIDPGDIDYINAHGTSTRLNDPAETLAVKKVFGDHARDLCMNSSKSVLGHLIAASGGPEFIFTVLSVNRDLIHPTVNLKNPDPKCDLDYVPDAKREKVVRAAISNSFGFGGQNASIVLKKYNRTHCK